jgi:hypothetical protein
VTHHKALLVLLSLAVAALASCGLEDRRRIDLLQDDPVLDVEPAGAERLGEWGHLGDPSFMGGFPNRVTQRFEVTDPHAFVVEVTTAAIEAGWMVGDDDFSIDCDFLGGYEVRAARVIDGLTAFLEIQTRPDHVEDADDLPWDGSVALEMASGDDAEHPSRERQALTVDDLAGTCLGDK